MSVIVSGPCYGALCDDTQLSYASGVTVGGERTLHV